MSWNDEKKIGAVAAPNPKSINPALDLIHIHGFKWVKNPGAFKEGMAVVVDDKSMYDALLKEGWKPTNIPEEYLQ